MPPQLTSLSLQPFARSLSPAATCLMHARWKGHARMCIVRWSGPAEGRPAWRGGPAADDPGPEIRTGGFPKLLLLL